MNTPLSAGLSADQIARYERDGFLLIEDAVPQDVLLRMQRTTEALLEASRAVQRNDDTYDLDHGHSSDSPRVNRVKTPHKVDPVFREALVTERMLGYLRPLLGENIRLQNSKLNTKAGGGGTAVEWHQDWAFYPHTNDDMLAIGVMLGDIGPEDGPLQAVPGSHRRPMLDHTRDGVFCGAIDPDDPDARLGEAVSLTGRAGTISFHHVRTLHGSAPNLGAGPRLLLLYELGAADAWPLAGGQSLFSGMAQGELWRRFGEQMVCGTQPSTARLADVPVLMPVPPPPDASSIFRIQSQGGRSGFARGESVRDAPVRDAPIRSEAGRTAKST